MTIGNQRRNQRYNRRLCRYVNEAMEGLSIYEAVPYSTRYNALYGSADLPKIMAIGCISVTSKIKSARFASIEYGGKTRLPSVETWRRWMSGIKAEDVEKAFEEDIARTLRRLRDLGLVPKYIGVAIDGHGIPRYDENPSIELKRGKYKNGTSYFHRFSRRFRSPHTFISTFRQIFIVWPPGRPPLI